MCMILSTRSDERSPRKLATETQRHRGARHRRFGGIAAQRRPVADVGRRRELVTYAWFASPPDFDHVDRPASQAGPAELRARLNASQRDSLHRAKSSETSVTLWLFNLCVLRVLCVLDG